MKNALTRAGLTLGLVAGLTASSVFAQQSPPPTQDDARPGHHDMEGRKGRMGRGHGERGRRGGHRFGRLVRELNLTDAQREQLRAAGERNAEEFRTRRQEMRQLLDARRDGATLTPEQQARVQALRTEFQASAARMENELLAILTPEQRTQLEQLRQQRKERRQEWRGKMRERRMERQDEEQ